MPGGQPGGGGDFGRHRELRERWLGLDPIGLSPATINISAAVLAAAMNVTRTSGTSLTASRVVHATAVRQTADLLSASSTATATVLAVRHARSPAPLKPIMAECLAEIHGYHDPPCLGAGTLHHRMPWPASSRCGSPGHQPPRGPISLRTPDTGRSSCGDSSPGCCPPAVSAPHHE